MLRGKCSACGVRISPRYPAVEAWFEREGSRLVLTLRVDNAQPRRAEVTQASWDVQLAGRPLHVDTPPVFRSPTPRRLTNSKQIKASD